MPTESYVYSLVKICFHDFRYFWISNCTLYSCSFYLYSLCFFICRCCPTHSVASGAISPIGCFTPRREDWEGEPFDVVSSREKEIVSFFCLGDGFKAFQAKKTKRTTALMAWGWWFELCSGDWNMLESVALLDSVFLSIGTGKALSRLKDNHIPYYTQYWIQKWTDPISNLSKRKHLLMVWCTVNVRPRRCSLSSFRDAAVLRHCWVQGGFIAWMNMIEQGWKKKMMILGSILKKNRSCM